MPAHVVFLVQLPIRDMLSGKWSVCVAVPSCLLLFPRFQQACFVSDHLRSYSMKKKKHRCLPLGLFASGVHGLLLL